MGVIGCLLQFFGHLEEGEEVTGNTKDSSDFGSCEVNAVFVFFLKLFAMYCFLIGEFEIAASHLLNYFSGHPHFEALLSVKSGKITTT